MPRGALVLDYRPNRAMKAARVLAMDGLGMNVASHKSLGEIANPKEQEFAPASAAWPTNV